MQDYKSVMFKTSFNSDFWVLPNTRLGDFHCTDPYTGGWRLCDGPLRF